MITAQQSTPRLGYNYTHPNSATIKFTGSVQGRFYEFVQTNPSLPSPGWMRLHYFSVEGFKTEGKRVSAKDTYQQVREIPESVMNDMLNELIRKRIKKIVRGTA